LKNLCEIPRRLTSRVRVLELLRNEPIEMSFRNRTARPSFTNSILRSLTQWRSVPFEMQRYVAASGELIKSDVVACKRCLVTFVFIDLPPTCHLRHVCLPKNMTVRSRKPLISQRWRTHEPSDLFDSGPRFSKRPLYIEGLGRGRPGQNNENFFQ